MPIKRARQGDSINQLTVTDPDYGSKMKPADASVVDLVVFLFLATFAGLSAASTADGDVGDCVYTVYIETGCNRNGGTDAAISLAFSSEATGNAAVKIANVAEWGGLMGANHRYFGRNNLDVFSGRGPCLPGPPCWMELSSDGSGGAGHRWYCNYVEVTATGPHTNCTQQLFTVEQWLARDRVPYQLTAARDYCGSSSAAGRATTED